MFRKLAIAATLALLITTTGCMTVQSPAVGVLYTDVSWAQEVPCAAQSLKAANGTATSFFGLFAAGDVSVDFLARKGGITKIHHVDVRTTNILGFGKLDVTVYGE